MLELAVDVGIPLAATIVIAWVLALSLLINGVRRRRRDRIIPIAALAIAALALTHSMVDFSLQIPGYTMVVMAVIGAGLAQSFPSRKERTISRRVSSFL